MPYTQTYFICGTPRSGSTLLCALLKSSGVAGVPESYFRKQDELKWAEKFDLATAADFKTYLQGVIKGGTTPNGMLGIRVMWGTMAEVVDNTRALAPAITGNDKAVLEHAFGPCKFLYLKRNDIVAQAVSLVRALQTDVWHVVDERGTPTAKTEPVYNFEQIHGFVTEMEEHNKAWLEWFADNDITPYKIEYETYTQDPITGTKNVLDYLGVTLPEGKTLEAANKKLSDGLSKEWILRYNAEAGKAG
ncbi:MAG: hypothetical protein GC136_00630 [Alphaproteobacteria bacterium]|nr:hypothetical protein [Alphaproteobacteria bacterium]